MKWILMLGYLGMLAFFIFRQNIGSTSVPPPIPLHIPATLTPELSRGNSQEVKFNDTTFVIYAVEIPQSSDFSLVANFNEKKTGETLIKENGCSAAINGGFYQANGKPLGLFYSEGSQAGKILTQNNLVTGIFWQDKEGKRYLGRDIPSVEDASFILQTGPLMAVSNKQLRMVTDEQARRSLLGLSPDNKLYMISVFEKENTFIGPLLADIPVLFNQSRVKERWNVETLLNLDGGSASFFYTKEGDTPFMLTELKSIGNLFCLHMAR